MVVEIPKPVKLIEVIPKSFGVCALSSCRRMVGAVGFYVGGHARRGFRDVVWTLLMGFMPSM